MPTVIYHPRFDNPTFEDIHYWGPTLRGQRRAESRRIMDIAERAEALGFQRLANQALALALRIADSALNLSWRQEIEAVFDGLVACDRNWRMASLDAPKHTALNPADFDLPELPPAA